MPADVLDLTLNMRIFGEKIDDMRAYAKEHFDKVDVCSTFAYNHMRIGGAVPKRDHRVLSAACRSG